MSGGGTERERERERIPPRLCNGSAESGGAQTPEPRDHDLSRNQESDAKPSEPPRRPQRPHVLNETPNAFIGKRGLLLGLERMYIGSHMASAYTFWKIYPCLDPRIFRSVGGEAGISA